MAPLDTAGGHLPHATELILQGAATLVAFCGIGVAWFHYGRKRRALRIARAAQPPTGIIAFLQAGWYVDTLYRLLFVEPFKRLSAILWQRVDEGVIDDSLDRMAVRFGRTGQMLGRWGSGRVSLYMFSLVAGATLMIGWFAWEVL
jgi:NADH-quinone oxidoreductase subunit L